MTAGTHTPLGQAMLRCASRSVDRYPARPSDVEPMDDIRRLWSDPVLRESVRIASSVLYDQVESLLTDGVTRRARKKTASAHRALVRYAVRISTRPTPFGTFGGFAMIDAEGGDGVLLEQVERHRKHVRTGFGFVRRLAADADTGRDLLVQANPSATPAGDRLTLLVSPRGADGSVNEASSVRATSPVHAVRRLAGRPVRVSQLLRSLAAEFPDVDRDVLRRFVDQMRDCGMLVSELDASIFDRDPLRRLRSDTAVGDRVATIDTAIDRYARSEPGGGERALGELYRLLREDRHTAQQQLQVDLQLAARGGLPDTIARDAGRALDALLRVALVPARGAELRAHAERFADRFGETLVPLPVVVAPERGIGFPGGYPSSSHPPVPDLLSTLPDDVRAAQRRLRGRLIERARRSGAVTVPLTPEDLAGLPPAPGARASSYDMFLSLDDAGRDGGARATIGPIGLSVPAGRVHGRFAHHDPACRAHMRELGARDRAASDDVLFCEIDYVSNRTVVNNIAFTPGTHPFRMTLTTGDFDTEWSAGGTSTDTESTVAPGDVLVGVGPGGLYLVHGPTGRPLICRTSNLVTPEAAADLVRFLEEIGIDGLLRPGWLWGEVTEHVDFLPGVEHSGVTLVPPQWRLPPLHGGPDTQDRTLLGWIRSSGVPQHVHAGVLDNRLLLHLGDRMHRDLLRREAASGLDWVTGASDPATVGWARDADGRRYASEVVLSLAGESAVPPPDAVPSPRWDPGLDDERILLPGRQWWYARLYGPPERQNELLERLGDELPPGEWFVVRYRDPLDHLRLRVRSRTADGAALTGMLNVLTDGTLLTRYVLDTYHREVERYGGLAGVRAAEGLFCAESAFLARHTGLCGDAVAMGRPPESAPDGDRQVRDAAELLWAQLRAVCDDVHEPDTVVGYACDGYRAEFATDGPELRQTAGELAGTDPSDAAVSASGRLADALADPGARVADAVRAVADPDRRVRIRQALVHMFANRLGLDRRREYQAVFLLDGMVRARRHRTVAHV